METETITIIAIHPENGVDVFKINTKEIAAEYPDSEFETFSDYFENFIKDKIKQYEEDGYIAIECGNDEVLDIIHELSK